MFIFTHCDPQTGHTRSRHECWLTDYLEMVTEGHPCLLSHQGRMTGAEQQGWLWLGDTPWLDWADVADCAGLSWPQRSRQMGMWIPRTQPVPRANAMVLWNSGKFTYRKGKLFLACVFLWSRKEVTLSEQMNTTIKEDLILNPQ